ncbi:hypothetical protein LZ554_007136 [Drepanopeziza brunnea f. sp. 'monogermtubi']|nr:hypothetical protein LZ554_007136 [Drepanopeziza brunnea f. sp. 'monogermtubi']
MQQNISAETGSGALEDKALPPLPVSAPAQFPPHPSDPFFQPKTSSLAPLLRPPVPSSRSNGGVRTPRLGLAIPPSPTARPVNGAATRPPGLSLQMPSMPSRPALPRLQLATPMGTSQAPYEQPPLQNGRPSVQGTAGHSASGGKRSEGGVGTDRDGGMTGLEAFDKLSLERGRTLDVEELDDDGWRVASMEKRIEEISSLGEGAGGAVTKCVLKGGKTIFALKIITTNPDPDVKKQIVRELGFNKDCASEHICRYYGAFVEPSTATISIAMEFCEGGSLDSIYREVKKLGGRTGEKVLGKISEGVLNGLTYLHGKKIIHRDIKPSNILLCRNGQVKLCDFGVSGEFGTKGDANTFIGTSYYMAPERITGQSYTITSDVWSTGVTLLEVAQHRFPFPADGTEMQPRAGLIDLLTYIVRQPIPKLKDEPDAGIKWTDNFKYFIECCLEKEPSRRASPWRMLEHPWMIEMRSKRVNMSHFLSTVWGWEEKKEKDRERK